MSWDTTCIFLYSRHSQILESHTDNYESRTNVNKKDMEDVSLDKTIVCNNHVKSHSVSHCKHLQPNITVYYWHIDILLRFSYISEIGWMFRVDVSRDMFSSYSE